MIAHPLDKCGTCERIPRSQITVASYNPRSLSPDQKRRLKLVLEKHGLCSPLVWNKRSGVLCGGHQRLGILDSLSPEKEWAVPVTVVDLDEKQERELNIALNNQESSGNFDITKLGDMFKGFDLDIAATGFDAGKLKTLIPSIAVSIPAIASQLAENKAHWQAERNASRTRQDAAYDRIATQAEQFTPETQTVLKPTCKHEAGIYETDDLFYVCLVFSDLFVAAKFKELMGLPADVRDHDGRIAYQVAQEWQDLKSKNSGVVVNGRE